MYLYINSKKKKKIISISSPNYKPQIMIYHNSFSITEHKNSKQFQSGKKK